MIKHKINSGERVKRAVCFEKPDRVPIRHTSLPAALYEHGRKLTDLWKEIPGDFGENPEIEIPHPDPKDIGPDGNYHKIEKDDWGVEWEYAQFGIHGHPCQRPLDDWKYLDSFKAPQVPSVCGPGFEQTARQTSEHKKRWYCLMGWINIFEILIAVRKFDDVLVDLMDDSPEINKVINIIAQHQLEMVNYYIAAGADGIMFADDWGTQNSLIIDPATWRKFFQPQYLRIMEPVKKAGRDIFFHSCGHILPLFDDLAELGINVIWPQLGTNDNKMLAEKCRQKKICVELHMDRQRLMSFARPEEIEQAVAEAKITFGNDNGGIIFHAEIDNGFTFERVAALLRSFQKYA